MDMMYDILVWNICALYKHKHNNELKTYLAKHDIICLTETWSKSNLDFDEFLPGFIHFGCFRKLLSKNIRNSGGVSLFIKNEMVKKKGLVQQIYKNVQDGIVILLNITTSIGINEVILYFVYVSPEGSPIYENIEGKDGIKIIQNNFIQIKHDYPNAYYFLSGDFNTRTKYFLDYIPSDNLNYVFGETVYDG